MSQEEALKWIAQIFEQPAESLKPETPRADIDLGFAGRPHADGRAGREAWDHAVGRGTARHDQSR